jgi:acetyltransferase-like isoleucine patch superfamily enzyme
MGMWAARKLWRLNDSNMRNDKLFWVVQGILKYAPFNVTRRLRSWAYRPFFARCGANIRIEDGVTIKYPSEIELGDYVVINQNCFLVGLGGLKIGRDVMIGNNSSIITTSHVTDKVDVPMRSQGIVAQQTTVGDDVWIGSGVAIQSGAHIESHSIVGAGAVVLGRSYPPYAVLGGVPARLLKMRDGTKPK